MSFISIPLPQVETYLQSVRLLISLGLRHEARPYTHIGLNWSFVVSAARPGNGKGSASSDPGGASVDSVPDSQ